MLLLFNIISLHVNIILIVSFVSFTLFIFSLFMFCFLLSLAFSSLFPFSVCVSFSVSSSRSISFYPNVSISFSPNVSISFSPNVSISFLTFLLLLGSLFIFDFFSFPLLLLPSPISFSYFLFPFGYAGLSDSSLFSFPAISLFLVRLRFFPCPFFSTSCCLFFLLVCPLSHLL